MAESLTDKLKLSKRDTGDINWGQGANANLDAVDAHAQQATLRPPRTLSASLGSGAVGANLSGSATYCYKITAVNAVGETTEGKIPVILEAQVTESASPAPVLLSWETVKGATGYKIYKSTTSGQEKFLASISGESTAIYTDDGNTATNGGISVPVSNTARTSVSKIVAGTNVTITPNDGTGDVTINASGGASADASDTVKGVTKLSLIPALATNPIAVGDNDPRNTNARTPSGAAGGDLGGTYPNPTVAKVNGTSVPASPSAGQVLTATGPTAAAWQTPAAGGSGYATTVVAAPTGVSATDTANIQSAIDGLPAAGGLVILREGNYILNASITMPAAKPVEIAGQGMSTKISADATFAATFPAHIFSAPSSGNASQLSFRDFLVQDTTVTAGASGNIRVFKFAPTGTQVFDQIEIRNIQTIGVNMLIQGNCLSGTKLTNVRIAKCRSIDTGTAWCLIHAGGALNVIKNIQIEGNVIHTVTGTSQAMSVGGEAFTITNNRIDQPGGSEAITANGGLIKSVIANNNIKALVGNCIRLSSIGAQPSFDVIISGNDIEADPASASGINLNDFVSGCVIIGNRINNKPITLTGTGGGGNLVIGNAASAVTDTMGGGNKIADTYVTSIKKAGAADITGAATLTPGSGISLTQTGNDISIAAAGGGYATAVVAAPSGTAATDTTNIQNAINAVNAAGGGTVVLREGIYQISTTINPKSGVTIMGQGKSTVQNTGLSGTSGGGSPSGTTLRGTTGLGSTRMISDTGTAPINVTFRDLNLDFGKVTRGSITGQDMVMKGSNLTFINVTFIMTASVGNPSVDITPSNTFDTGKHKFIGCDFYDAGTAATICYQLGGLISGCYFEGTVATFNEMVAFVGAANVTNCYFASNKNYNNGMVYVQVANNSTQAQTVTISNCFFKQYTTAQTRAIFVDNITNGNVVISGNVGDSSNAVVGNIHCPASSGLRNIIGNVGFSAYSGGNQNGNDGQTAINSGAAAGGDLSGTLPNPTVAKVNGTSVPAAPSAGQVLTATGPTAATWQAPASGGYATVVVGAPTGVEATDTANLQAALDAVDTLKGGEVLLREGTYLCGQLIVRRHGLKLRGLNGNMIGNSLSAGGSKIRFNVSTQDGLLVQADHVTIEGVGFQMTNVSGGFACILAGANFTSGGRSLVVKNCSFVEIRQSSVALRVSGLERLVVDQSMFEFNNPFGNSVSYTAVGIKVEGGAVASLNGVISNCLFWDKNANPPSGGAVITVKFIVLDGGGERYKISGCHGRGFAGGSASEPSTFIEVKDVGNWACSSNRFDQLNRFIKDVSTALSVNVTVTGNVCYQSSAPSPEGLIDLVAARSWSIVGNAISSTVKSIRLQAGTQSNVVVANALGSAVDNTGTGNVVANNT